MGTERSQTWQIPSDRHLILRETKNKEWMALLSDLP